MCNKAPNALCSNSHKDNVRTVGMGHPEAWYQHSDYQKAKDPPMKKMMILRATPTCLVLWNLGKFRSDVIFSKCTLYEGNWYKTPPSLHFLFSTAQNHLTFSHCFDTEYRMTSQCLLLWITRSAESFKKHQADRWRDTKPHSASGSEAKIKLL